MSRTFIGGPLAGREIPDNPRGFSTYNYADMTTGMIHRYDARTGRHLESSPSLGGPFAEHRPDRQDWYAATRPERIRAGVRGRPAGKFRAARRWRDVS